MKESKHEQYVQTVLQALLTAESFMKLVKCLFSVKWVLFLRFIITDMRIEMNENCIFIIVNWSESESVCEMQTFLSFVNFYWRFIQSFFYITAPLTETTKRSNAKLKKKLILWRSDFLSAEIKTAFRVLIEIFTSASFLQHFDVTLLIHIETDASDYAISDILTQKHLNGWRSTVYFSQKMISAEQDYKTHDRELLTIVESFCHWRYYLKGCYLFSEDSHRSLQSVKLHDHS